jgi:hypothetical protein
MQGRSGTKRRKEVARLEKQRAKETAKVTRRRNKPSRPEDHGIDPDIAGIVPGPQPVPPE